MDVDLFPMKGNDASDYDMKTFAELEVWLHSFISLAL
jgi:hypothetical protein